MEMQLLSGPNFSTVAGDDNGYQMLNTTMAASNQSLGTTMSSIEAFSVAYQKVHGYISIFVCLFGIMSNVVNIIVLTRKNMITSTNYILTALATADMLTMVSYLPYAIYFYCIATPDSQYGHSFGWIVYLLFHTNFIITCHTISMWLTVSLAVFRYIVVCHHTLGPKLCNIQRAKITIITVIITTTMLCIPNYVVNIVVEVHNGYWFSTNGFVSIRYMNFNFWLYGVVIKIVPCILLSVLSSLLIRAMQLADKKRRKLITQGKRAESERTSEHNRTTAMLVGVVLSFVITELPQGLIALASGINMDIFKNVYVPLGDIMDILVLVNSAVNFMLYCTMSRQFRDTFKMVFLQSCQRSHVKTPNGISYSTINTQSTKL